MRFKEKSGHWPMTKTKAKQPTSDKKDGLFEAELREQPNKGGTQEDAITEVHSISS